MPQKKKSHAFKPSANLVRNKINTNFDLQSKKHLLPSEVSEDIGKNEDSFKSTASLSTNTTHSKYTSKLPTAEAQASPKTGLQQRHGKKLPFKNREIIQDYFPSSPASITQNGHLKNFYQKEDFSINSCKHLWYKYFAEGFLWLYFVHSWIYVLMAENRDVLSVSDGKGNLLRTVEEGLVYKILWCFLFGIVADLLSWKVSFLAQAVSWAILLSFLLVFDYHSILRLFSTICVTSSPLLVSLLGIAHIWNEDCLGALCRLGLISHLVPLCLHYCLTAGYAKVTFLPQWSLSAFSHGCLFLTEIRALGARVPMASGSYPDLFFFYVKCWRELWVIYLSTNSYMKMSGILLPLICTLSLFAVVVLIQSTNGSGPNTGYSSSSASRRKISTFLRMFFSALLAEFFIFIPVSLWMAFSTSHRDEDVWITCLLVLVCLGIYSFMIPLCTRLMPLPGALLTWCCRGICIVYAIVSILGHEWISAGKLSTTLMLYATYGIFETTFESLLITEMKDVAGTMLASVVSLHLIVHFILGTLLTCEFKPLGSKLTPSKIVVSFETSLRALGEHLSTTIWIKSPGSEDSLSSRCPTYCCGSECQSGASIFYLEQKCHPLVSSFTSSLTHYLPEVDLMEMTTLANFGFFASIVAIFFIFFYRWK